MMRADSVVIVSGVGLGVGRELVAMLADGGCKVVLVARDLAKLAPLLAAHPDAELLPIAADIRSAQDCEAVATQASDRFGRIDSLINNAFSFGPHGALADARLDADWSLPFETNVKGTLRMVQAIQPALQQSRGSIVMVNTVASRIHKPGAAAYAIAKSGLQTAARLLAAELGPLGIRVNSVFPGYIDGAPLQGALEQRARAQNISVEDVRQRIVESLPLRRIPTDRDVAEAILFLASARARGITGASLDVNAGEYIPL